MKTGYPKCPCAACQEVLHAEDGPRRPCDYGHDFEAKDRKAGAELKQAHARIDALVDAGDDMVAAVGGTFGAPERLIVPIRTWRRVARNPGDD